MIINEDYVSFETAKLLKEKGFNEYCRAFRSPSSKGSKGLFYSVNEVKNTEEKKTLGAAVACPTLQMAMKWLREVHNIFIAINMIDTIQKHYFFKPYIGKKIYNFPLDHSVKLYTTYEEACEAAIKYCLENLI